MRRKVRDDVLREIGHASTGDRRPNFHAWDLTDADLTHLHLPNVDFSNANLTGANLHGTALAHSNLTRANLTGAHLDLTSLIKANLTNANLAHADLSWSYYDPTQLLDTRGLHPGRGIHGIPRDTWDSLLPKDRDTRRIIQLLLDDWGGTLRDALATAHRITPADPDARRLLFTLLADWEGTVEEAAATAEELHKA